MSVKMTKREIMDALNIIERHSDASLKKSKSIRMRNKNMFINIKLLSLEMKIEEAQSKIKEIKYDVDLFGVK